MGTAAYKARIFRQGTPTFVANSVMSLVALDTYQISESTQRIAYRGEPHGIKIDGVLMTEEEYSESVEWFNHLTGTVKFFAGGPILGELDFTGYYVPILEVGGAHSYNLNIEGDILDDTAFDTATANGGFKTKIYGILDISFSIDRWSDLGTYFQDLKTNREEVLIQVNPGGVLTSGFRGWFVVEQAGGSGDIGALEDESISFNLNGDGTTSFVYYTPYPPYP